MLSACAMSRNPGERSTGEHVRDAAVQPLSDVGIMKPKIAAELDRIVDDPYGIEADATCARLAGEVAQLNGVLGPDYDAPNEENDIGKDRRDRAINMAGRMGAGMLIPFRSIVREISGGASAEREYRTAMVAGIARRAYLKGRAVGQGCDFVRPEAAESLQPPPTEVAPDEE